MSFVEREWLMRVSADAIHSWKNAFMILLDGPDCLVGPGFRWKRNLLSMVITWMVGGPFITYYMSMPYQGAIPAESSLVKVSGKIIFSTGHSGPKSISVARMATATAGLLEFQDPEQLGSIREWEKRGGSGIVYVEGFRLRDGAGLFWPIYMMDESGSVILSRDRQLEILKGARNPFGPTFLWMILLSIPLWMVCLRNVYDIKIRMGV